MPVPLCPKVVPVAGAASLWETRCRQRVPDLTAPVPATGLERVGGDVAADGDPAGLGEGGQVGGAALDVVTTEPLAKDSALLGRDNVILTPHTAFYSVEALEELQTKCASDVARVLSGEKAVYPISA